MLIIGRKKPKEGTDFGGVVVLYELFLEYLRNNNIEFSEVDLNWRNYQSKISFLLIIYPILAFKILSRKSKSISFHGTTTDFTYYAPFVVLLCKIVYKRVTLRKFGGNFDQYFEALNPVKKTLVKYALKKSDCVFFETKHLVEKFEDLADGVWFPNVRNIVPEKGKRNEFNKKFIFVSHIKETKGVTTILEAIQQLSVDYTIHLFGPIQNYSPPKHLADVFEKHYGGVLQPDEVIQKMNEYDVLLLPTYHAGEGYPGAIIEAYSQGLPVISTNWRAIPEIVEDGETGFLIEPRSEDELVKAIQRINGENYRELSGNSLKMYDKFQQVEVMKRIINYL